MDSQLHRHHKCKNVEELKEKLEEVRQSIPASYLHNAFDGMNARMKGVLDLNGGSDLGLLLLAQHCRVGS